MKTTKLVLVTVLICAAAMFATTSLLRAEDKPCCEATVAAGLKCEHACCVKAAKDDKVCEKCHPKKEDKKN